MDRVLMGFGILAVMGAAFGLILSFAAKVFAVEKDPREEAILECLPGANCGGCGYPGCSGYAAAVVAGKAPVNACAVGEGPVAAKIAEIMGNSNVSVVRKEAVVHCTGGGVDVKKYEYLGIHDCLAAARLPGGGPLGCDFGCLGMGTCERVCPFDAIHVKNGVAVVDENKCKACGKCVDACPRHIISLEPFSTKKHVSIPCSSKAKGPAVMKVCTNGCIGCGICAKSCPKEAITVENNLAKIDYDKCVGCGICASKCPRHTITVDASPSNFQAVPKKEAPEPEVKAAPDVDTVIKPEAKTATETPAPTLTDKTLAPEIAKAAGAQVAEATREEPKLDEPAKAAETPVEEKPVGETPSVDEALKVFEEVVAAAGEALKEEEFTDGETPKDK